MKEGDTRIIGVRNPNGAVAGFFGGVIVNDRGHVKVGETLLDPSEVPLAVAIAAVALNDGIDEVAKRIGEPDFEEELAEDVWNGPGYMDVRQAALGEQVTAMRSSFKVEVAPKY